MPIRVEHDLGDLAALAALATAAGATALPPIQRPSAIGGGGGGGPRGGGGGRGIAAGPGPSDYLWQLTMERRRQEEAMRLRLQEAELALPLEIKRMEAEAKARAQQFEFQYTAKQKQDIARINNAKQDLMRNPNFSPAQRQVAMQFLDLQAMGIEPSMTLRDLTKPTYREGQGIGDIWYEEDMGGWVKRNIAGEPELIQRADQSLEAIRLKAENERRLWEMKERLELLQKDIDDYDPKTGELIGTRRYEPWEVDQLIEDARSGAIRSRPSGIEVPGAIERLKRAASGQEWMDAAKAKGFPVAEGDKQLPAAYAAALAYLRMLERKYKTPRGIPADLMPAAKQAAAIVTDYENQMGIRR